MEEHGAILDKLGHRKTALASYDLARKGRQRARQGMPDRPYFLRHCTTSVAEIHGYTNVLRAGASKRGAFVHVARGHAYLSTGRPRLALLDYEMALKLKPDQTQLFVAKGEALAALGRHGEALRALDRAVAGRPKDAEARGSRACALIALGRIAEADADWLKQLELLPRERHDARGCVLLRLGDYRMALGELEQAVEKNPDDPWLHLYYLGAARRLGAPAQPRLGATDVWPGPLIGLHSGALGPAEILQRADVPQRRAEALFQLGVCASDRIEARRWLSQVVEIARPDTIEYSAARHEIERARAGSCATGIVTAGANQ